LKRRGGGGKKASYLVLDLLALSHIEGRKRGGKASEEKVGKKERAKGRLGDPALPGAPKDTPYKGGGRRGGRHDSREGNGEVCATALRPKRPKEREGGKVREKGKRELCRLGKKEDLL